jgi:peptide deformylase
MNFELGLHSTLTQHSEPWDFEVDQNPHELVKSMIAFMIKNHGIGLAANQIGIAKRVFVMGTNLIQGFPAPFAAFNPKIIEYSNETVLEKEGCLSYPNLVLKVKRPQWIVCEYQDANGDVYQAKFDDYVARCFHHELDHLDGVCFVERVSKLKLDMAKKKLRKNSHD